MTKRLGGTKDKDGNYIVLKEGNRVGDECLHNCGEYVMGTQVTFSHRDPRFLLAGNGSVHVETVPYCPKCERRPISGYFEHNSPPVIDLWDPQPNQGL